MLFDAGQNSSIRNICDEQYITSGALTLGEDGFEYTFFSINVPIGYAIQYIQLDHSHSYYGCNYPIFYSGGCWHGNYYGYEQQTTSLRYTYSEGPDPNYDNYYGGWDNLTIDFSFNFETYWHAGLNEFYGHGYYSVWPTSEYQFTLYYRFVPVVPVE